MSDRLDAIRQRAEAATRGPWGRGEVEYNAWGETVGICSATDSIGQIYADEGHDGDVEFVIHSREDIPWLLERVAALEAEVERLRRAGELFATEVGYEQRCRYDGTTTHQGKARLYEECVQALGEFRRAIRESAYGPAESPTGEEPQP